MWQIIIALENDYEKDILPEDGRYSYRQKKKQKLTQAQLAEMTGIHRAMISRLETLDYMPYIKCVSSIVNYFRISNSANAA